MSDTFYKVKIWTKLILLGLVILFVAMFCLENYANSASVWLFGSHQTTVLELLAATFLCGVVATLLARPTLRTIRQIGELTKKENPPQPAETAPEAPAAKP